MLTYFVNAIDILEFNQNRFDEKHHKIRRYNGEYTESVANSNGDSN